MNDNKLAHIGLAISEAGLRVVQVTYDHIKYSNLRRKNKTTGKRIKSVKDLLQATRQGEEFGSFGIPSLQIRKYEKTFKDFGIDFVMEYRNQEIDNLYNKFLNNEAMTEIEKKLFEKWHTVDEHKNITKEDILVTTRASLKSRVDLALEDIAKKNNQKNLKDRISSIKHKVREKEKSREKEFIHEK